MLRGLWREHGAVRIVPIVGPVPLAAFPLPIIQCQRQPGMQPRRLRLWHCRFRLTQRLHTLCGTLCLRLRLQLRLRLRLQLRLRLELGLGLGLELRLQLGLRFNLCSR
eukprot:COSAG01_NODE_11222_length_1979_cov_2.502128_2_plen_108_part_00